MTEKTGTHNHEATLPPIAAIAASAGGLGATKLLLQHMPADSGIAIVVIHHLSPDHDSMIAELLQAVTEMEVAEVDQPVTPQANHVYTIPPDRYLELKDGRIHPVKPTAMRGHRRAVDHFLISLATNGGPKSMCAILSGTGTDGSLGIKEINEAGGLVLAQNPEQAEFRGMPASAIATQMVDRVLDAEHIPELLVDFARSGSLKAETADQGTHQIEDNLDEILQRVRNHSGRDFTRYKKATLLRRIHRRMALARVDKPEYYLELLDTDPEESHALFKDLLISVTRFFRDAEVFKYVAEEVLPGLCSRLNDDAPLRIWVPGVATGEEAYSLAIIVQEYFLQQKKNCPVILFATDIDTDALEVAREGRYLRSIEHDVSAERLDRFFVREGDHYRVNRDIRKMVTFAEQDILADPPYSRLDLISCRNLMIYLDPKVQQKIMALFHFALKPEGFLLLGTAETVDRHLGHLFKPLDPKHRIYRRIGSSRRFDGLMPIAPSERPSTTRSPNRNKKVASGYTRLGESARQAILDHVTTCAVVVDRSMTVIYIEGKPAPYLTIPTGRIQNILPMMAADGLRIRVRQVLQKVIEGEPEAQTTGQLSVEETDYRITITARSLGDDSPGHFICFFDRGEMLPSPKPEAIFTEQEANQRIAELEHLLKETREDLTSTIEELETSNEELRASNEETISVNEELRSSSEELETSRVELQSLNEELTTLNQQLQEKVEELRSSRDDMENLLASTEIATLFLDRDLNIRLTTPPADRLLKTRPADQGRSLAHFVPAFSQVNLFEEARKVLSGEEAVEREIQAYSGRWYTLRLMPYRKSDGGADGVVLTLVDINRLKRIQTELEDQEQRLRLALEGGRMGTWAFDPATDAIQWDQRMCDLFGVDPDQPPETTDLFFERLHPEDRSVVQESVDQALRETGRYETEFRIQGENGCYRWLAGRGRVFYDDQGRPSRMLGVNYDITEEKRTDLALQANENRFRLAIKAMQGMVYEWHFDTGHVWRSDGLQRLLGRHPEEVSADAGGWDQLIHPDDLSYVRRVIREARENHEKFYDIVYRIRHGGGHHIYIHDYGIIEYDESGRAIRVVGSAYDVTDRKTAEEELKRLNEELEQRVQMRTQALHQSREKIRQLAHMASTAEERERRRIAEGLHDDVQQLLAACTFSLQGLTNGAESAEIEERVNKIVQWSQEALDATRTLIFDLSPAVLYEIGLDAAVSHLASQVKERYGLALDLDRDEAIDPLPEEIRVFIYSTIRELVLNVAKHAEVDRARVEIEREKKAVRVEVTDHGRGFLPEEIEQFRNASDDHCRLGLMSLKERIATVGGTMQLVSAPGKGTNIRLFVPVEHHQTILDTETGAGSALPIDRRKN